MLPWLTIYDHTNYARWGPVYLAGMENLKTKAPKVHAQFIAGTNKLFNQVPADQATEWMNKTCKVQNGIIGTTRNDQARDYFCVTWPERSRISQGTRCLFSPDEEEITFVHSGSLPPRRKRDIDDVKKLVIQLKRSDVLRVATTTSAPDEAEETTDAHIQSGDIPLVSLAN